MDDLINKRNNSSSPPVESAYHRNEVIVEQTKTVTQNQIRQQLQLEETKREEDDDDIIVTKKLPKRIFSNGYFTHEINNNSINESILTENKILCTPSCQQLDNSLSWRDFFSVSIFNLNSNTARKSKNNTSNNNDIESQSLGFASSSHDVTIDDGIYKPLWQYQSANKTCIWGHGDRTVSRCERDGVPIVCSSNDNDSCNQPEKYYDVDFTPWIRPQDVQSKTMKDVYEDVDEALTIHQREEIKLYALEIVIDRIKFHRHPFTIEEETMAHDLEILYRTYISLNDRVMLRNFELRLCSVMKEVMTLQRKFNMEHKSTNFEEEDQEENISEEVLQSLYHELIRLTSQITELESKAHSLYSAIMKKWDEIVQVRERQTFQSTTSLLVQTSSNYSSFDISTESLVCTVDNFRKVLKWFAANIKAPDDGVSIIDNLLEILDTLVLIQSSKTARVNLLLTKNEESYLACPPEFIPEVKRREKIRSERYIAKLLIDDQEVSTTSVSALNWPSLEVHFNRIFDVVLDDHPNNISIQILNRKFGFDNTLIATVHVIVPEEALDFHSISLELMSPTVLWYHFSETPGQPYNRCGLEGSILVSTRWNRVDESKYPQLFKRDDIIKPLSPMKNIHYSSNSRIESGESVIKKEDQRDSQDEALIAMKPSIRAALNKESMRFTLRGTKHSYFNFSMVKEPLRHQLMKQRKKNEFSSTDNILIPLNEWDIIETTKLSTETRVHSRMEQDLVESASLERSTVDPKHIKLFVKRLWKLKKVMQVWKNPTLQGLEDIVHDASLIRSQTTQTDLSWISSKLFPPRRRSLVPFINAERREIKGNLSVVQNAYLTITLMGANNVHARQDQRSNNETFLMSPPSIRRLSTDLPFLSSPKLVKTREDVEWTNQKKHRTSCLARVRFQNQTHFTSVASGDCPLWEQVIEVPLLNANGQELTPLKLKEIKESIEITLFDNVRFDFGKGGGYYDDEDTVIQENRFLGFINVQFSTVECQGKVTGNFILNTPEVLLGYETFSHDTIDDLQTDLEHQQNNGRPLIESNHITSINCSISLEPKIGCNSSHSKENHYPSNESESMIKYARKWIKDYKARGDFYEERNLKIFALGLNGKSWLVNRFLVGQAPPISCESSIYRCAHFVSLIPTFDNWTSFQGFKDLCDVWLPSQTCLNIIAGNWSNHAVLLANYFIYLSDDKRPGSYKMDVYLVMGSSTDGQGAVFVLTKSHIDESITLWNPMTGKPFNCHDERSPHINIGILVSPKNMYANLQQTTHPSLLNYDLTCKSEWKPFCELNNAALVQFNPNQDARLIYTDPKSSIAKELEIDLLDQVKTYIRGLRRSPSSFNSDISSRLRYFLDELEHNKRCGTPQKRSDELLLSLSGISRGKHVFGFPLHFPFSNIEEILAQVELTGIHQSKHPDVEFAAAVKIFPYECGVYSVWVFLCILSPDHFF